MTDPDPAEGLRALLTNRQMPDSATFTLTLGEVRAAFGDRASAEGLRESDYLWLIWFARKSKGTVEEVAQRALEQHPGLRAALRDTGPRPDSGIDDFDPAIAYQRGYKAGAAARRDTGPRPDSVHVNTGEAEARAMAWSQGHTDGYNEALADTGPRPDSGIETIRGWAEAHGPRVGWPHDCGYCGALRLSAPPMEIHYRGAHDDCIVATPHFHPAYGAER